MAFSVRFVSFFSVSLGCFFIPPGQEKKKLLQQQQQRQIGSFLLEMSKEYLVCLWLYGILKISEWQKLRTTDKMENEWIKQNRKTEKSRIWKAENIISFYLMSEQIFAADALMKCKVGPFGAENRVLTKSL